MNLTCLNRTLVYSDISFSPKGVQFRQFSLYIHIIHNNNTLFFLYLIAIHLCNTKHKNHQSIIKKVVNCNNVYLYSKTCECDKYTHIELMLK